MDNNIGLLMTCPMPSYLEHKLQTHFTNLNLIKLWHFPPHSLPPIHNSATIKAIITDARTGTTADLIEALPNLEIVCTYSVGFDRIDLEKCRERGIRVTNTPDVLTDDVADLAVGLILAVLRKICASDGFIRNGLWKSRDFQLATKFSGKSVGIVGLGRIGSAVAMRAEAFGCPISYFSRSKKPNKAYKYCSDIIELATNCDILVVACALTEETRHIINRAVLDALGAKGILINIARGAHIDEPELVSALLEGRLGGAGLDVFENEPEVPEELFALGNVVIQSHTGSDTVETCQAMADLLIQNLEAHFLNKPLITPVI